MCKIDLPRKNMVIERARKEEEERLQGINTHTHTLGQITRAPSYVNAHSHMLERVQGKSAGLGGIKKNFFSCSLVFLPIKKNGVHQQ